VVDDKIAFDIYKEVKYKNITTTKGRLIFNKALPDNYEAKFGYINEPINSKLLNQILKRVYVYFNNSLYDTIQTLKMLSIAYSTVFTKSVPLGDMHLPPEIQKELNAVMKSNDLVWISGQLKELTKKYKDHLEKVKSPLFDLVESGSSKSKLEQLAIAKGLIKGVDNEPYIVKGNFSKGLTSSEFFESGNSARGGLADRVLNTAHTGYLERKLIYAGSCALLDNKQDCNTDKTLDLIYDTKYKDMLIGRYCVMDNNKLQLLTQESIKMFATGDKIKLRSPLYCTASNICKTCYGKLADKINSKNVGVIAAQVLGERGTQSIMRTFHTGGAVDYKKVNLFLQLSRFNPQYNISSIEALFAQDNYDVYCKTDTKLFLAKEKYKPMIDFSNKIIQMDTIDFFTIVPNGKVLRWILDEGCTIKFQEFEEEENYFSFVFKTKDLLLQFTPAISNINFVLMRQIFEQSVESISEVQLYYRVLDIYHSLGMMSSVHIETIISEICRDPDNISLLYRHSKKWDKPPYLASIKEVPYLNNPLLGLFFENPQKSIEYGLVTPESRESSILGLIESQ